jgi:2-C-methyl-D-erythritol 4-phosphate cytidylyltransferase
MYRNMKVSVLVAAAGKGKRMKSSINKQYLTLGDKPVLAHTLQVLQNCSIVDEVIVVAVKDEITYCKKNIVKAFSFSKVRNIVEGGYTRQQSVANGIEVLNCDLVVVHDGARPFFTCGLIERGIKLLLEGEYKGTACAVPLKDTVKVVSGDEIVVETLDRSKLRAVQTPQCFYYPVIKEVYNRAKIDNIEATDDAMLLEHYGYKVKLYPGSYRNIKITTPEDLTIARTFVEGGEFK